MGVLLLELVTGLAAADGARAPGHHLLAESLLPHLGDIAALQARPPRAALHVGGSVTGVCRGLAKCSTEF